VGLAGVQEDWDGLKDTGLPKDCMLMVGAAVVLVDKVAGMEIFPEDAGTLA